MLIDAIPVVDLVFRKQQPAVFLFSRLLRNIQARSPYSIPPPLITKKYTMAYLLSLLPLPNWILARGPSLPATVHYRGSTVVYVKQKKSYVPTLSRLYGSASQTALPVASVSEEDCVYSLTKSIHESCVIISDDERAADPSFWGKRIDCVARAIVVWEILRRTFGCFLRQREE